MSITPVRSFFALALACASLLTAAAGDLVPIKASVVGQVTSKTYIADPTKVPLGTPFLIVTADGAGRSSHIGHFTITYREVFHLELSGGTLFVVSEGTFDVTAANGDHLFGTYTNRRVNGGLDFTGTSEFTGGTGRFAGASGAETTVGAIEPNLIDFSYSNEGVISTVGSNRGNGH